MNIDVEHDPKQHKYYATIDGQEGHVVYSQTHDGTRVFHHTFVPPEVRGQGVANEIVRHALDETRREGHRYVATCPFVQKFIERHPEYKE
ncbi:MAG TPA: GNAT family N-acetyltransferase [Thermoanaerobaculia bacterium]|nr:GNAT family N-acetyltransferase [Thermoanaerobaculia bacterium]